MNTPRMFLAALLIAVVACGGSEEDTSSGLQANSAYPKALRVTTCDPPVRRESRRMFYGVLAGVFRGDTFLFGALDGLFRIAKDWSGMPTMLSQTPVDSIATVGDKVYIHSYALAEKSGDAQSLSVMGLDGSNETAVSVAGGPVKAQFLASDGQTAYASGVYFACGKDLSLTIFTADGNVRSVPFDTCPRNMTVANGIVYILAGDGIDQSILRFGPLRHAAPDHRFETDRHASTNLKLARRQCHTRLLRARRWRRPILSARTRCWWSGRRRRRADAATRISRARPRRVRQYVAQQQSPLALLHVSLSRIRLDDHAPR